MVPYPVVIEAVIIPYLRVRLPISKGIRRCLNFFPTAKILQGIYSIHETQCVTAYYGTELTIDID
jgi:hypothetical protein